MKKNIFILFSLIFLFPNFKSLSQPIVSIDNFMPGVYNDLGALSDEFNLIAEELKRNQNYRFGDFYLRKRDNYLRNRMNSLRTSRANSIRGTDMPYMAGIQYFGVLGGFGLNTFYSKRINKDWRMNVHLGLLSLSNRYQLYGNFNRFNTNVDFSVLIMPLYLSAQKFIINKHIPKRLKLHLEAGVGPVFGMDMPYGYGFFGTFSNALYRITPGAFVGSGINVEVSKSYVVFADIKYHVIVFNNNLGYTNNFSTPSVYFGVSRGFSFF